MKRITTIIICLLLIQLAAASTASKTDEANEAILERLLSNEGIASEVMISGTTITVSIEASEADQYDSELIAWWGTIFGMSALLEAYEKDYTQTVIENQVNGEPYAYVSANMVSIDDFASGMIDDAMFWDEALITADEPTTEEIEAYSGLPASALAPAETMQESTGDYSTTRARGSFPVGWLIFLIIFIGVLYLCYRFPDQTAKHVQRGKHHIKHAYRKGKEAYEKHGKPAVKRAGAQIKKARKAASQKKK